MANRSGLKVYEPVGWELKPIGRDSDHISNCLGEIVEAFCLPLAANSGLEAEMKALLEGILRAKSYGRHLWMETNAEILCSILDKGHILGRQRRDTP
ncbi:hypothetical protein SASPL_129714 [Salvia splendens]|uniref:Uncharacterized protein n=2 Tax=Salvia splendens TaxID=180675 RepID=A0A8X8XBT3_SALSN|nr:hypothetical protein SASPL_129714 [Salvia splendens]